KIDQLLDLSHDKGFKVNITTNGTLINKRRHRLLNKPALRQMNFSLHSFDGHPGSQDKEGYVRSILSFIREATSQSDLIVSLRLWNLTQDNKTNAEIQKNRELLSIIENEFDLSYQIEEKLTPGKGIKIAERVFINQDYEFQWPALHEEEDDG
ncbi:hypothetical protein SOP93_27985, partial [Peribacillus frigoritolerans]|nr:hypothetical protein [Peribacillus frigoritolerans]